MLKVELLTLRLLLVTIIMKNHTLRILLTLELIILIIIIFTLIYGLDMFYVLIMICIGACEGAVGLRAIIRLSRLKRDLRIR